MKKSDFANIVIGGTYNIIAISDVKGNISQQVIQQLPKYPFLCFRRIPVMLLENNGESYNSSQKLFLSGFNDFSDLHSKHLFSTTNEFFLQQAMGGFEKWERQFGYSLFIDKKLPMGLIYKFSSELRQDVKATKSITDVVDEGMRATRRSF